MRSCTSAPIPIGMVGGGPGGRIGRIHRIAMRFDERFALVAGAFSSHAEKSYAQGALLGLEPDRAYADFREMAAREAARSDGIQAVVIVTPHDSHGEIATAFAMAGIHVLCEKPLTLSVEDALALERTVRKTNILFATNYNYSYCPMVREAAHLVRSGALGRLMMARVAHAHGRAVPNGPDAGLGNLAWHNDPAIVTKSSVVYNLGTHAHHLLRFVSGCEVEQVAANMTTFTPSRPVYDNLFAQVRLTGGVEATFWASMVATGREHGLEIAIYGEKASIEWRYEDSPHLVVRHLDGTSETYTECLRRLDHAATRHARMGMGHPEGYFSTFANLYADFADAIERRRTGSPEERDPLLTYPGVDDGVRGVQFVAAITASHDGGGAWTALQEELKESRR